jgi:hypothetical protein
MKSVLARYLVNYPQIDPGTVSFAFSTNNALGTFSFVFKWLNPDGTGYRWNGWCTLPSGETRQFGCVPDVIDWTGFADYGIVIDSALPALGLSTLIGNSTLYLLEWGVD